MKIIYHPPWSPGLDMKTRRQKWLKLNRFYFWQNEKLPFTSFFTVSTRLHLGVCLHTTNFWEMTSGVARSLHRGRPHDTPADGFLLLHLTSQYPIISLSLLVSQGVSGMMTDRPLKLRWARSHHLEQVFTEMVCEIMLLYLADVVLHETNKLMTSQRFL